MTAQEFDKLALENVLRVKFIKRTNGMSRTMLCTKCLRLLASAEGKYKLHWTPPNGRALYRPFDYNNVIVWDIKKHAYRTVCCDNLRIMQTIPADEYWQMLKGLK